MVSQQCLGQGECGDAVCIKGSISRVAKPGIILAQGSRTWAMRPESKKECLVLWVWFVVGPGGLRASSGVDCFVPCPPLVAPRTLNP